MDFSGRPADPTSAGPDHPVQHPVVTANFIGTGCNGRGRLSTKTLISIVDDDEGCRAAITGLMKSLGGRLLGIAESAPDRLSDRGCQYAWYDRIELHRRLQGLGYPIPTIPITSPATLNLVSRRMRRRHQFGLDSKREFDKLSLPVSRPGGYARQDCSECLLWSRPVNFY
jgi:hypothetical protein